MDYQTYLEKFRVIQIEYNDYSQIPMTEQQFTEWKKPIAEIPITRKDLLQYQNIYLRLRKLVEKKFSMGLSQAERETIETELKKTNEAYQLVAEKNNLV